ARALKLRVLLEEALELLELPPEAAPRHQAHAGEEQTAERVDAALLELGHVDVERHRIEERLRAVALGQVAAAQHQLGQKVIVQIYDERLAMEREHLVLDFDCSSVHGWSPRLRSSRLARSISSDPG